tara:strand:+ start:203 stop:439 length:237 start_codon:yes stop_codon:yes gene_type:complete
MNDKIQHFIVGLLLSLTGIIFTPLLLLGFIFAFGKELYDHYTKTGVAEINDVIATLLGAILAVIITTFITNVNIDILW